MPVLSPEPPHRTHGAQAGLAALIVNGGLIMSRALDHQFTWPIEVLRANRSTL